MLESAMYFVVLVMTMMMVMVTTTTLFIVSTGVHAQETYTLEQLQGMSQEELEQICTLCTTTKQQQQQQQEVTDRIGYS